MANKKNKVTRRKKNNKTKKKVGLDTLSGFTTGQPIYCFRFPDKALARGKIRHLFKTDSHEFAEFIDEITGQFRATLLEDIRLAPPRKQVNAANSKIAFKIKKSKDKK